MIKLRLLLTIVGLISLLYLRHHFAELVKISDLGNGRISAAKSFEFPLYLLSVLEMFGWMGLLFARIAPRPMDTQFLSGFAGSIAFICSLFSMLFAGLALGYEDQAGGAPYQYELSLFYLLKVVCLAGLTIEVFLWFFDRQATDPRSAFYAPGQSR